MNIQIEYGVGQRQFSLGAGNATQTYTPTFMRTTSGRGRASPKRLHVRGVIDMLGALRSSAVNSLWAGSALVEYCGLS